MLSDHTKKKYIISIRFQTIIALWEGKTSKTSGLNTNGMLTSVMVVQCYKDQLNYQDNWELIIMRVHCKEFKKVFYSNCRVMHKDYQCLPFKLPISEGRNSK